MSINHTLIEPIDITTNNLPDKITTFTINKPKLHQLAAIDGLADPSGNHPIQYWTKLIAACTNQSEVFVNKLGIEDYMCIKAHIQSFLLQANTAGSLILQPILKDLESLLKTTEKS